MGDIAGSRQAIARFSASSPVFVCVISHTATSEIPGLTVAGANPGMVKFTSPADAEFLHYGRCRCIPVVPATPDGKPTPALITRAALQAASIPLLVVDSGAKVKPAVPAISFGTSPGGNIAKEDAMPVEEVERALAYGRTLGAQLARASDLVVVGESIPGGTTTALAVLGALGVDGRFKVSSSMPDNPHELKNRVVASAYARAGKPDNPIEAVARYGDPMMPAVAGIAAGAIDEGGRVMLAGGTQMAAVLAIMKKIGTPLGRACIGTTCYVAGDRSADLAGLVRAVARVPVLACDLHLGESAKPGLQAFAGGFVKEGVGAGGASIAAMLKARIDGEKMRKAIEREYEASIERRPAT
ncbi:MAG: nicotinate mononucleotide-dependent phosphoribosyltransferase CobT [Nitrososphaera sp.]|uniref:nicotinate mononucleotide-dependent phosphoribosyltransferase CobT n=1 Tax=Nitrososphaera sp. TaxID=1971748 RepID=UPI003D6E3E8E